MRTRRKVASLVAFITTLVTLVATPVALAADGVGAAGRIDDRFITFFCFGVIAFFAILVTVLSLIQDRLDARKEQRRYDLERFER